MKECLSETSAFAGAHDALSQVLNTMRISGSLLLNEKYQAPWAISIPSSDSLGNLLKTNNDVRIAAFHYVERGYINITLNGGENTVVEAGQLVICFSGSSHTLSQGEGEIVIPFGSIMQKGGNIFSPTGREQVPSTSLICGVFLLHDSLLNPLLSTLPSVLKIDVNNPNKHPRLHGVINLMSQEFHNTSSGGSYVLQRYLEILCTETIRTHMEALSEQAKGWLSAIKDPLIGRAIEEIHAEPGYKWSVKNLARKVMISPSRFAARFSETLGEPPMVYVTKWRMYIATQLLDENNTSIDQIANSVGYDSMAAFSRAFKRHVGMPPATWRARSIS